MSRATKLIKKIDKLLSQHDTFGDNPEAFAERLLEELDDQIQAVLKKDKPQHWASIYVERDRANIKAKVLNQVMDLSS